MNITNYFPENTLQTSIISINEFPNNETFFKILATSGKKGFYKALLESNKEKQEIFGQFHTTEDQIELVLKSLPQNFIENLLMGQKVLDPSCGVGNFLIRIVKKTILYLENLGKSQADIFDIINKSIIPNLYGIEIDPSLSKSVDTLFKFEFNEKIKTPNIYTYDSLFSQNLEIFIESFEYVIGNPPWVEVKKLSDEIKNQVQSQFAVSNLYAAFIIDSYKYLKPNGLLAFVVPRSFTGGKYFSQVRKFLKNNVTLKEIYYFNERNILFHGGKVLQEVVVISYQKNIPKNDDEVKLSPNPTFESVINNEQNVFTIKYSQLFSAHDEIMILPNSIEEFEWISSISKYKNFEKHGFRISTGQLVQHRSKDFLRKIKESGAYRILFSTDIINSNEIFTFNNKPNEEVYSFASCVGSKNLDGRKKNKSTSERKSSSISDILNNEKEIIIFRRRSHKGDRRRFVGVYLNNELNEEYFLDNSLNFICYTASYSNLNSPSLNALYKILRSDLFEKFFAIISSNTQINKNDLYLFGIPDLNCNTSPIYKKLEEVSTQDLSAINKLINKLYEY